MVLVAVDDLLFSSKIRTAARAAGVELIFARTRSDILARARELRPSLAIFDLNAGKIDPIATIREMKCDPALSAVRTVGYVSHVDTAVIQAAREAGADQVMPRSAFAAQLASVLGGGPLAAPVVD